MLKWKGIKKKIRNIAKISQNFFSTYHSYLKYRFYSKLNNFILKNQFEKFFTFLVDPNIVKIFFQFFINFRT